MFPLLLSIFSLPSCVQTAENSFSEALYFSALLCYTIGIKS